MEKSEAKKDPHKSLQVKVMSTKTEETRLTNIYLQAESCTDGPNLIQEVDKDLDRQMKEGYHHRSDVSLRNSEARNEYLQRVYEEMKAKNAKAIVKS